MSELALLDAEEDELFQRKARKDILAFTLYTKPDYEVNWHHRRLAKKLNQWISGEIRYLMVFMPPRHGKSELVSRRLPAYLHGVYPDAEIMAVSYLDSLAGDMTIDAQKIIDSAEYKRLFPGTQIYPAGARHTTGQRNSSEHHIVGRKGKYRGQGVGGSFTGKGANFILIDDPIKGREIADSIAYRDKLWDFWINDLYSRLETDLKTGRKGQVLITLTRWHEDDLAGRLLAQMYKDDLAIQWDVVKYPAIKVSIDDPTDPREVGEALWPNKYDLKELNAIKKAQSLDGGPRAWSSLYQQDPVPDGGGLFRDSMFEFVDLPGGYDWTFTTADTAYKEKEENDFTVFSVWGLRGEDLFLIDCFREQLKSVDVEGRVYPMLLGHVNYGYRATLIEPKGHGIYLNQKWAEENLMIPSEDDIKEFYSDRRQDKVARANNVIGHLAHRKVYIGNEIPFKEELVAEALHFPKGKHDDWVDTLVDGLKKAYSGTMSLFDVV
jgi:predicted phage terminase large subunit-like protein